MLSFQKLDVYKCAIEFLALVMEITQDIPRGHAAVVDQLKRAALSVPLNIGEAAGRTSKILGILDDDAYRRGSDLLEREVEMLTKLCR